MGTLGGVCPSFSRALSSSVSHAVGETGAVAGRKPERRWSGFGIQGRMRRGVQHCASSSEGADVTGPKMLCDRSMRRSMLKHAHSFFKLEKGVHMLQHSTVSLSFV